MKWNHFLPPSLLKLLLVFVLFLTLLVPPGCNDKTPTPVSEDWLNLTVKFTESSTEAIRDISLRAIEKIIADSVKKLSDGDYKDFHPMFVRTSDPRDSLTLTLSVGFRDEFGVPRPPPQPPTNMSLSLPAKCLCATECKICRLAKVLITMPQAAVPAFPVTDYLNSVETSVEHPIDGNKK